MIRTIAGLLFILTCLIQPALAQQGADSRRDGEKLFMQMHRVLTHPRCLNCHPVGDSPKQGDTARSHVPPMTRGPRDEGPAGMHCAACHQTSNYAPSGVPGAPKWHVAPRTMAWENKSPGEICRSILDRRTNGNKSLAEIVRHLVDDELVAWGWNPGTDANGRAREPVPIPKSEFTRIVKEWAAAGAACPL